MNPLVILGTVLFGLGVLLDNPKKPDPKKDLTPETESDIFAASKAKSVPKPNETEKQTDPSDDCGITDSGVAL